MRAISGLRNDALDRKCFGRAAGRKRHFERLQHTASSPDEVALLDGKTLLHIVDQWDIADDQERPYAAATKSFHSKLWLLLLERDLAPATYSKCIQEYAAQQGWIRIGLDDAFLYRTFLGEAEPAIQHGTSNDYHAMLHTLAIQATPDALATLIALFRGAMHAVLLEQAIAIRSAIKVCLAMILRPHENLDSRAGAFRSFERLLWQLVQHRVFSNVWLTQNDWRSQTGAKRDGGTSSRLRIKEFKDWVAWYVDASDAVSRTRYGQFPIVPKSPRTSWLEANRDELICVYERLAHLRHEDARFREVQPLWPGVVSNAQIEAARLHSRWQPPDIAPARLPRLDGSNECVPSE